MRPRLTTARALAPALLAAACALPQPGARPEPAFDPARIAADVAWLADDAREGRGFGSAGLAAAADWVARELAEAGLQPGAPDGGFLQRFEATVAVRVTGASLAVGRTRLLRGRDFEAFASSASGEAAGELVFAGHGLHDDLAGWDDYAGLDVRGRVVLILDDRPAVPSLGEQRTAQLGRALRVARARDLGAAAVLIAPASRAVGLAGGAGDESPYPSEASAGIVALGLSRAAAERLVTAGGARLADLQAEIERRGAPAPRPLPRARVRVAAAVERERGEVANVVAVLPGADRRRRREAVVIGAHLDHLGRGEYASLAPDARGEIHNGADDNASGVAGLLALARAFALGPPPRRSLVFVAFTGEEAGLAGSSWYAEHPAVPLADTAAMLDLDMIGRLREDRLVVHGLDTSPEWPERVVRAARGLSLSLEPVGDGVGPSDHTPFALRSVPSLLLFTGVHADYHTPSDDAEKVDAAGVARVVELARRLVRELADARGRPPFGEATGARAGAGGPGERGAWLGTIPAFGEAPAAGVRIQGVRRGSPAELAGLRGGDVIVELGGASVATLEELAALLRSARAGETVEIAFVRDGRTLRTRATLGVRR
jgi:hypothetical protein